MKNKTIKVPVSWIKRLIEISRELADIEPAAPSCIAKLTGYIESAESLLTEEVIDNNDQ